MPRVAPLALIAGLLSAAAGAQEAGDWRQTCEDGRCSLTRTLVSPGDGRTVATVLAVREPGGEGVLLGAALPLGLALGPGARLSVGGDTIELAYDVCFPDGCRATTLLDPAALEPVLAADAARLSFFVYGREVPVAVEVPLDGLADALAALPDG